MSYYKVFGEKILTWAIIWEKGIYPNLMSQKTWFLLTPKVSVQVVFSTPWSNLTITFVIQKSSCWFQRDKASSWEVELNKMFKKHISSILSFASSFFLLNHTLPNHFGSHSGVACKVGLEYGIKTLQSHKTFPVDCATWRREEAWKWNIKLPLLTLFWNSVSATEQNVPF